VVRHLLIAIAVLFVAMLFLLSANLWAALLVVLLTSVVVVDTLGLVAFAGLNLTPEVAMCTLLYVPLGLGFFVRPVQGYLRALGTRDHRARRTFEKIGGVVVDYMVVLFSVVLFLAAAATRSLFASFTTLALLVALGLFHGLALLPVVLQWIGPAATFESEIVLADVNVESNTTAHLGGGPQVASSAASGAAAADPANPFAFTPQQQHRLQQQQQQQRQQQQQQADAAAGSGGAVEMGHWRVSGAGQEHEASQTSRSHHDHHHAIAGLQNRTPQKPQQQQQQGRWI
jgi:signal transduction histidine kinase